MRIITTFLLLAVLASSQAQEISRTLENYNYKNADLVIFAYGSDNPVKIGTVDAKGNLKTDLSKVQMPELNTDTKDLFTSELWTSFSFTCGNSNDFGPERAVPALKGGNVALWANNEWTASFFLVSDPELKSWLEDPGYNSAIKAVFWEITYVEKDVSINMVCTNELQMEDSTVELTYTYDLNLKKGFNWVEYTIEDVYVTNPEVMASFPSKVRISNLQDPKRMMWLANYFF